MQNETLIEQGRAVFELSPNRLPGITGSATIWDIMLQGLAVLAVASYLLFYVLIPDAYVIGPALLLLLAVFGFRWKSMLGNIDYQSKLFISVLLLFFVSQGVPLVFHGEDVSEFDLSTRYIAAALVLLFVLSYSPGASLFFLLVAVGATMTGAYAFYEVAFDGARRVSAFDNPIHYGNGALALGCLALAGLIWAYKQPYRWFWMTLCLIGFAGGVYASLMSETRSGWVAAPVFLLTGLCVFWRSVVERKLLTLLLFAVLIAGFAGLSQVESVERRAGVAVAEFEDYFKDGRNGTSVGLRLDMWKAGFAAFQSNPAIGSGPAGTDAVIDDLIASGSIHPRVREFRHLHNQYIDAMARYGISGLLGYLLLLTLPFFLFLKKSRSKSAAVCALGFGGCLFVGLHAVVNLTQSMLERNIGVMMFVFMIVFIWGAIKVEEAKERDRKNVKDGAGSSDACLD